MGLRLLVGEKKGKEMKVEICQTLCSYNLNWARRPDLIIYGPPCHCSESFDCGFQLNPGCLLLQRVVLIGNIKSCVWPSLGSPIVVLLLIYLFLPSPDPSSALAHCSFSLALAASLKWKAFHPLFPPQVVWPTYLS